MKPQLCIIATGKSGHYIPARKAATERHVVVVGMTIRGFIKMSVLCILNLHSILIAARDPEKRLHLLLSPLQLRT